MKNTNQYSERFKLGAIELVHTQGCTQTVAAKSFANTHSTPGLSRLVQNALALLTSAIMAEKISGL